MKVFIVSVEKQPMLQTGYDMPLRGWSHIHPLNLVNPVSISRFLDVPPSVTESFLAFPTRL